MTDENHAADQSRADPSVPDNDPSASLRTGQGAVERAVPPWRWVHPDNDVPELNSGTSLEPRTVLPWRWVHPDEPPIEEVHRAAARFRAETLVLDRDHVSVGHATPWYWVETNEPSTRELRQVVLNRLRGVADGRTSEVDQTDVDELLGLAQISLEVGNHYQAQRYLSRVLEIIPNDGGVLQQLAHQGYATLSASPVIVAIILTDSPYSWGSGPTVARARGTGAQQVQQLPLAHGQRGLQPQNQLIGAQQPQAQQPGEQPQEQLIGAQKPTQQPQEQLIGAQKPAQQPQEQLIGAQKPAQQPQEQLIGAQEPTQQPQAQQPGVQPQKQQPGEQPQGQQPGLQPQEQQAQEEINLQDIQDDEKIGNVQDLLSSVFESGEVLIDPARNALAESLDDVDILDLYKKSIEVSKRLKNRKSKITPK